MARPRRTPINGTRQRLSVKGQEAGYQYRIVNDTDSRIQDFIENGWELVQDKTVQVGDKRVASPTSEGTLKKVSVGGGQAAYVMRIKKEFYDEDQAAKQARVDQIEASIKSQASSYSNGKFEVKSDNKEG